jgi:hypothetical protein
VFILRRPGNEVSNVRNTPLAHIHQYAERRVWVAQPTRFGQFSAALCIAQIIPLVVSSSTQWRIYAWVFGSHLCLVCDLSVIPTVRSGAGLVFFCRHCHCRSRPKINGLFGSPPGVDAATNIPVIVVNGKTRGPVLALVSGAHGTEYTSIIAIEKLINLLDPSQIVGTVILVPLVNIQSFEQKVPHVNPIDNKSMNRFYPGKADGTQTERASSVITKQVVDRRDYLIDYHGGDLNESLRPYAYWAPTGKEAQDQISKAMVLAFGLDHIIIWRDRPTDLAATRYLDNTSTARGKPSIVVEAGFAGTVEADDVALLVQGTFSTMSRS